ncbi:uncharacterized protein DNG_09394 [Cephalotrichum gorgonifer]|uniref:Uncharacterized protein n=1 Tax=Cephalotrichum gorgonifer TaxID=2041049 RepID=A0AAE8N8B7_9PEZI|nr:uncharacterized protein DNG_09394 [Cephalotrichum gorgonifer]
MALFAEAHDLDHQTMAYEEYMRLQSQHDSIRESLDMIRSPTSSDSTTTSPSLSPTRGAAHHAFPNSRRTMPPPPARRDNQMLDESALCEVAAREHDLLVVNEGIKRALTELLNCDLVRADKPFRMWVQSRLLETEKELRSRRRRRCFA